MNKKIDLMLKKLSWREKLQRKNNEFILDLEDGSYLSDDGEMLLLDDFFLQNSSVYLSKHNRFAPYPKHRHEFIELNYMYSGKAKQVVDGNPITLKTGEILVLDKGTTHSLCALNENDILINFIFASKDIDLNWLSKLHSENNVIFNMLGTHFRMQATNRYMIFHSGKNIHVQNIMQHIISEHFAGTLFKKEIIKMYVPILFTELIGSCRRSFGDDIISDDASGNMLIVIECLRLIKSRYSNISLDKLAKKVGYNRNYLSDLLKKKTGQTFMSILTKERLLNAKYLLENTDLSVEKVIENVGLLNKTHFYNLFRNEFGKNPGEFRR